MQKVVGSNPISRFREDLHLQVFFVGAVGWCVCVAGQSSDNGSRLSRVTALGRWSCAGILVATRTADLLQACRRSSVPAAAAVGRLSCKRHVLAHGRLAGAPPAIPTLEGESDFSPDTVRSILAPHSHPGEPRLPAPRALPRTASEAAPAVAVTGGLGRGNRSGSRPHYRGSERLPLVRPPRHNPAECL